MRTCVATMVDAGQASEGRIGLEDVDVPRLGMAAMRFIQAIEQGHHGVLWDAASDAIRQSITRDAFIHSLAHRHDVLGRGTGRRWTCLLYTSPSPRDS